MYIDSINKNNEYNTLSAFGNIIICSDAISDDKTITFPVGYEYSTDTNLSFKVLFKYGHNCVDDSTHMTLSPDGGVTEIPVVVNKYGVLIPLPIHTMDESGTTVYKSLQANTILEMYYTSDYDGNNNPAFVVIGNPIVLSSDDYKIYADGNVDGGNVGDVKSIALVDIPSYGWLECNGQSVLRTDYPLLFSRFNTQTYDSDPTHTLLSRYGYVDADHFNLPDYREVALVGVGQNSTEGANLATHDIYTVGEFKDDQLQNHTHYDPTSGQSVTQNGWATIWQDSGVTATINMNWMEGMSQGRSGTTTHGKQKGVIYIIKVL
jgi:hypothetical protein